MAINNRYFIAFAACADNKRHTHSGQRTERLFEHLDIGNYDENFFLLVKWGVIIGKRLIGNRIEIFLSIVIILKISVQRSNENSFL